MNTNDNKIKNYNEVLDTKYGEDGTPERLVFEQRHMISIPVWYYIRLEKRLR
jgi:hypothetical protein